MEAIWQLFYRSHPPRSPIFFLARSPRSALSQSPNSNTVTRDIRIEAAAELLPKESEPDRGRYFYRYRVRITNEGATAARLISRRWLILDANNQSEEVQGDGVVGKQPNLAPGEMFEYESYCPLRTEWGTMEGAYSFLADDATQFDAKIGRFFLVPTAIGEGDTEG